MEINLIAEACKFLILGMSTVFMFLILLVFVTHWQGKLILKYFPIKEETQSQNASSLAKTSQNSNNAVIAAIAIALHQHKNKQGQKNG